MASRVSALQVQCPADVKSAGCPWNGAAAVGTSRVARVEEHARCSLHSLLRGAAAAPGSHLGSLAQHPLERSAWKCPCLLQHPGLKLSPTGRQEPVCLWVNFDPPLVVSEPLVVTFWFCSHHWPYPLLSILVELSPSQVAQHLWSTAGSQQGGFWTAAG